MSQPETPAASPDSTTTKGTDTCTTTSPTEAGATSPPADSTPRKPWSGLGYEPVPGLTNRIIARWLRSQRKNIRRMLEERGFVDLLGQMEELRRNPRMNFMQKNQRYQVIMNEYIARVSPPTGQAAPALESVARVVDLRDEPERQPDQPVEVRVGISSDAAGSVQPVADESGVVIEE